MDEVRLALRRVIKRPGAALASIVTLGAAIGAAAATASLLSAVLLRPLPVAAPERLVVIGEWETAGRYAGILRDSQVYPLYTHVRASDIFESVAAGGAWRLLVNAGAGTQDTRVYFVSANFFDVLGVLVPIGRGFRNDEDKRGAPLVAVLSDRYWRRALGADVHVVGRVITVGGRTATVVGVVARGFRGLDLSYAPEIYLPLSTVADVADPQTNFFAEANHQSSPTAWVTIVGRIGVGSTLARVAARVATLTPPPDSRGSGQ